MPRQPQVRRKKTTRNSERRELRAILDCPSIEGFRANPANAPNKRSITLLQTIPSPNGHPGNLGKTSAKRLSLRCQTRRLGFLARLPEVVSAVRIRTGMAPE